MQELDLYQVDAFTDRPFAGNPAAVVPLVSWLDTAVMQAIALENNLSETVFFIPLRDDPDYDFHIRWFTPAVEVDLCGHATLAAAWILFNKLAYDQDEIRFKSRSGLLTVSRNGNQVVLDFPTLAGQDLPVPEGLEDAIGQRIIGFRRARKNMAILKDEAAVLAVDPDLKFVAGLEGDGLIVTAAGENSDCASRYFAPHAGIDEDPVTGSAHCTIIPYWAEQLGRTEIFAKQVSGRVGDLYCTMAGDRVRIAGEGVLFLTGTIRI